MKTFFLVLLLAVLTTAQGDQPIPHLEPENGEFIEDFLHPGVAPEDYDPTVPFTCFITTPKACARAAFEILDFFQLPDNAFPGLVMRSNPDSQAVIEAVFFDAKNQFISQHELKSLTHKNLLGFFEENKFPLFDFEGFSYEKSIHAEFDWGGHHYVVALMRVPYLIAAELADRTEYEVNGKMEKGYLAQIESEEEFDAIKEHLDFPFQKLLGFGVWLGAHKDMNKQWFWENGQFDGEMFYEYEAGLTEGYYTNWAEARPFKNDRNTDRCMVWTKRGYIDTNCWTDSRSVVFEYGTDPQVYEKKVVEEVEEEVKEVVEEEKAKVEEPENVEL